MKMNRNALAGITLTGLVIATLLPARAQERRTAPSTATRHVQTIVPNAMRSAQHNGPVQLQNVKAAIEIVGNVARTTLDLRLHNTNNRPGEADLVVPIPSGATVREVLFDGQPQTNGQPKTLPADQARRLYESIVARQKDPVLLEFVGSASLRTRAFPIPAGGDMIVRLRYEQILPSDGPRSTYVLPRAESLSDLIPWDITAQIVGSVATVYSPTHPLNWNRKENAIDVTVTNAAGPLHLAVLRGTDQMVTSVYTYPEGNGGYFLMLASAPPRNATDETGPIPRDVTMVIDRSGSMKGPKIEQVRAAATQILHGLAPNERVHLITYASAVHTQPVVHATPAQQSALHDAIAGIQAGGSTNLHAALQTALQAPRSSEHLPLVLFMTDGQATTGITDEVGIRALLKQFPGKRVFPVGIGADVNSPLLEGLATDSRAQATFILPNENVEAALTRLFSNLEGPVVTDLDLVAQPGVQRIMDTQPSLLPDLYEDDQLIVLGRYVGTSPFAIEVRGTQGALQRTFQVQVDPARSSTAFDFVPRLWASRRIAQLTHEIRQIGANPDAGDKAIQERIETIIDLSVKHGVLTEYTAFLATEGTDLGDTEKVVQSASENYRERAVATRAGRASLNQSWNNSRQLQQAQLNRSNTFMDGNLQMNRTGAVQQVRDRAFFQRSGRWIDSQLIRNQQQEPDRTVRFGTPEYAEVLNLLLRSNHQAVAALQGEVLLHINGEKVLIQNQW